MLKKFCEMGCAMLKLTNITKTYITGALTQQALDGISISFRKSEFVSVLGPSGSGKTTLLNIIGGLDQYTSGDLIINGKSTKEYNDGDWDTYRNHSVGFVFQSYNLIPHQTVLRNVELALTLSGVSKSERRRRAVEALKAVGLDEHIYKKPNQMSGGQMQRVSIARALINNPDILLADEPTGALDSETSLQVMELLKEIARDRLVIMVTHNPELAQTYSTRIVKLLDGRIIDDSDPYEDDSVAQVLTKKEQKRQKSEKKKKSMSFFTALSLSLNNLMTKKGRTFLTSFAGSIGIIGIALILSVSAGFQAYIDQVQEDTLTSYPITIEAESVDMSAMLMSFMNSRQEAMEEEREPDRVYSSTVMYDMLSSMMTAQTKTNNLTAFKKFLDEGGNGIMDVARVHYSYDFKFDVYTQDKDGGVVKSDVMEMMQQAMMGMFGGDFSSYFDTMGGMYQQFNVWNELLPEADGTGVAQSVRDQYDVLYGKWPENYDEVVIFVDRHNEISDLMLYALGFISTQEMNETMQAMMAGNPVESETLSWSYEELCDTSFKFILPSEYYELDPVSGGYVDMTANETGMSYLYTNPEVGIPLKVVGIVRPTEDGEGGSVSGQIGYTAALTQYAMAETAKQESVQKQLADETVDVFTGLPFRTPDDPELTNAQKVADFKAYYEGLEPAERVSLFVKMSCVPTDEALDADVEQRLAGLDRQGVTEMMIGFYAQQMGITDTSRIEAYFANMTDEELMGAARDGLRQMAAAGYAQQQAAKFAAMTPEALAAEMASAAFTDSQYLTFYDQFMPATVSEANLEQNLEALGYATPDSPSRVSLYVTSFEDKDTIARLIEEYNKGVAEEDEIEYTDLVALLMDSVTTIIDAVSYVLIAFVSISLVVSSIMIGIITYISVLERTKEIGILRAIGASKRDVGRVFNAETLIVGFGAGLIGILASLIIILPINLILHSLTGINELSAVLPAGAAAILVLISMFLTFIAGLVPSRIASRKNPVEALRTE